MWIRLRTVGKVTVATLALFCLVRHFFPSTTTVQKEAEETGRGEDLPLWFEDMDWSAREREANWTYALWGADPATEDEFFEAIHRRYLACSHGDHPDEFGNGQSSRYFNRVLDDYVECVRENMVRNIKARHCCWRATPSSAGNRECLFQETKIIERELLELARKRDAWREEHRDEGTWPLGADNDGDRQRREAHAPGPEERNMNDWFRLRDQHMDNMLSRELFGEGNVAANSALIHAMDLTALKLCMERTGLRTPCC